MYVVFYVTYIIPVISKNEVTWVMSDVFDQSLKVTNRDSCSKPLLDRLNIPVSYSLDLH